MKKLAHLVLVLAVLGALSWALWRGWTAKHAEEDEKPAQEPAAAAETKKGEKEEEHSEAVVELTEEKAKAAGIIVSPLEKTELAPARAAFGRVLDPTPLLTLDADLSSAEAALAASRAEFERAQKLLAAGENTSRKVFETAEAQFRGDEIKANNLRRQARLQWGEALPPADGGKRHAFVETLVQGEAALVRAELLPGDTTPEPPKSARILVLGREEQPIPGATVSPATETDARTQAEGFIISVEKPPFPLRPGMAVTVQLEFGGEKRAGFLIPRSALLRHDGRVWVYAKEKDAKDEFTRKLVQIDSPLEKGWFIEAEHGGLDAEDAIVTQGAQVLLSEEMKAASGSAPEE